MASSEDLMKRIEALNGGPLRYRPPAGAEGEEARRAVRQAAPAPAPRVGSPIVYTRDLPRGGPSPRRAGVPTGKPVLLEEAVPGNDVAVPGHGYAYQVETALEDLEGEWEHVRVGFHDLMHQDDSPLQQRIVRRCQAEGVRPEEVIFVDVETTGLGHMSPLFLIGTLVWEGGDLVVRQYLARHYGEEPAVVALFVESAAEKRLAVSFNGKSFDLPYTRTRAAANGIPFQVELAHFDLLHESRRIWKTHLPNCRLQTLEQHICGHPPRRGDIPGGDIPEAYHAYVRTNNAAQIVQVMRHNLLDLVTLAELMTKLPELEPEPEKPRRTRKKVQRGEE